MDKENATVDVANMVAVADAQAVKTAKKTRSKSLGPGGLEAALKEGTGNRRTSVAAPLPKSILKAAIQLSPLKEIPSRKSPSSKGGNSPARTPTKLPRASGPNSQPNLSLSAQNTPTKSPAGRGAASPKSRPPQSPRAHDRSHEESEKRQKERAERRRTLAARRVSFAPEATLHTWDVVEYIQDSTTSSASTNSTRRASAFAGSPHPNRKSSSGLSDPPSTPPEQVEDDATVESPAHQRDVHQKRRRRRSSANFGNPDEALSSSPYSGSSVAEDDTITSTGNASNSGSDTEDDEGSPERDDDDTNENTGTSVASNASGSSESARLDAALRQAVIQAQTRQVEYDTGGEVSMEMAGDEITAAFKPWSQRNASVAQQSPRTQAARDQENVDPFSQHHSGSGLKHVASPIRDIDDADDMSMDMTSAVGGILRSAQPSYRGGRKSMGRRQSVRVRRRSSGGSSSLEDGTMDLTAAVGGIQSVTTTEKTMDTDQNEDLSMEFTSVFGGIRGNTTRSQLPSGNFASKQLLQEHRRGSSGAGDGDEDMEMTAAVGGILRDMPVDDNETAQMDMTTAVGGILPSVNGDRDGRPPTRRSQSAQSPLRSTAASRARASVATSETGSPALATLRPGRGDNSKPTPSSTPVKKPSTPSKQLTPKPARPITPEKNTPLKNVAMRSASPKRLFQEEIKAAASPITAPSPFNRGNPGIILAPPTLGNKRHSITLSNAEHTGSPRAAALLDRRASIGDTASIYTQQSGTRGVRFGNPQELEAELMREREADERRESRQFILEQEADAPAEDVTANLKDLIGSMTPKKAKLNGRKSLAVGGGKALLGKRPRELDEPDEDEDASPKRVRAHESPVKKIRLPAPPSKSQTIGKEIPLTPSINTPMKGATATTPKSQGRFKDAEALASAQKPMPTMGQTMPQDSPIDIADEPIHLQDFLNMTNIRFMELNTTKRRHTTMQAPTKEIDSETQESDNTLEAAVVAGSCTVPMLGLYQHSCRELKKYISAGRDIVREIEEYTYEENPPIFREYLSAAPAARTAMENQFKNIKSHARLLSKEMWYEWRMKLLEGINEDLMNVANGLQADDATLRKQEELLEVALPPLAEEHNRLASEHDELRQRAEDLASCDPEELEDARQRLAELNASLEEKRRILQQHEETIRSKESSIEDVKDAKTECSQAIKEAKKLREDCRGWSPAEVSSLKAHVDELSERTGWRVVSASSKSLTMVYEDDVELFFNPNAWSAEDGMDVQETSISLTYVAGAATSKSSAARPLTTEKRFFLQLMQAYLHSLPRDTEVGEILRYVSNTWNIALDVADEVRILDRENVTSANIVSDERLVVKSTLLIPNAQTKVFLSFSIEPRMEDHELVVAVNPYAEVVYGERYKEDRMRDFMSSKIGHTLSGGPQGLWSDAVRDMKGRLIARGRKP